MTREEIEKHQAWKYISGLSATRRHLALSGGIGAEIEREWNVTIEEWSFTRLMEIPAEWASISVTDSFRNVAFIMVLKPNAS